MKRRIKLPRLAAYLCDQSANRNSYAGKIPSGIGPRQDQKIKGIYPATSAPRLQLVEALHYK